MPDARSLRLSTVPDRVRRFTRRRRRPLAAALAAVGVLVALSSLRQQPAPVLTSDGPSSLSSLVQPGEAAVPITLSSPGIVRTLARGQLVDVVAVPREGDARAVVVATAARVVDIPEGGSALSASSTSVILVAVRREDALDVIASSTRDVLSVAIQSAASR